MQLSPAIRYLTVPLSTAPLMLIGLFSVLLVLSVYAGLMGIPLGLLLLTGFFNYGFLLLDSVAAGVKEPPVLAIEMLNPISGLRAITLLVIVIGIFFISDAATYWFGPAFAALLGVVCALVVPAILAVQGATGSVVQSLNLWRCWQLMLRLGSDYALIVICIVLFWALGQLVVFSSVGAALPLILRVALIMYGWLATFTLIGGVLYERHDDIGMEDANSPEWMDPESEDGAALEKARDQQIDRIYAEWRGGARANAWQTISTHVQTSGEPVHELRWMYQRIARWPEPFLANRVAQEFIPLLFATHHYGEALDIARERLRAYADFRPLAAADLIRLARLAREAGDRPAARALLRDFQRFYPDDALQPVADDLLQQLAR